MGSSPTRATSVQLRHAGRLDGELDGRRDDLPADLPGQRCGALPGAMRDLTAACAHGLLGTLAGTGLRDKAHERRRGR
jgi:hypothetical protein